MSNCLTFNRKKWLCAVWWLLIVCSGMVWANEATGSTLQMVPEQVPGVSGEVLVGRLEVFENRLANQGRKIPIKVVVAKAKSSTPKPDPLFVFVGGPGQGAANLAGFLMRMYEYLRKTRDIVFIDIRGTGASNPLNCQFQGPKDKMQTYLLDMFELEYVKHCKQQLSKRADLRFYTTTYAMQDVDDVRKALGYEQINLTGGSYGTRSALEYMRLYPDRVRTVVLRGLAPATVAIPQHFAKDAQAALDALINNCAGDPACDKAYPSLSKTISDVLAKFDQGPVRQELTNPETKTLEAVSLSRGVFVTALRAMLYNEFSATQIPYYIQKAASGDFSPFILFAVNYNKSLNQSLSDGLYLSITCAEDLPFIQEAQARKEAKGTFLRSFRLDAQMRACDIWPQGSVSDQFRQVLKSDIPTLLFSGTVDPVTPPYMGEFVAKGLSRGVHLVLPNSSHAMTSATSCIMKTFVAFIEAGDASNLDQTCVDQVKRLPFKLPESK